MDARRREVALARMAEALTIGILPAILGGATGLAGGLWLVNEALRVDWAPGWVALLLARGRGQVVRHLAG